MTRFSLRTLFIVVTVAAVICWLYRCGQLECGIGRGIFGPSVYARVFSIEARANSWQDLEVVYVCGWISYEGDVIDQAMPRGMPGIFPGDPRYTRERHPWNSREWKSHVIKPIVRLTFFDPFAAFAPSLPSLQPTQDTIDSEMNLPARLVE